MPPAVDAPMRTRALHGMDVVDPYAVAVDESALARTVHEVFDGADGNERFDVHNRSDPKPLVVSAELLRSNWTLRHPAWTSTRAHVDL